MIPGLWGRRISGRVIKDNNTVWFLLYLETEEGKRLCCSRLTTKRELHDYPSMYGDILDKMVEQLEAEWAANIKNMP